MNRWNLILGKRCCSNDEKREKTGFFFSAESDIVSFKKEVQALEQHEGT